MQVVGSTADVFLHERKSDPLRNAAVDLTLNQRRIDGTPDIMGRVDPYESHGSKLRVDFDLGDLSAESVGRIRHALTI